MCRHQLVIGARIAHKIENKDWSNKKKPTLFFNINKATKENKNYAKQDPYSCKIATNGAYQKQEESTDQNRERA